MSILLLAIVLCLCFTYKLRTDWWGFIDIFCFFMAAFTQFMAITLGAKIPAAGKKFSSIAVVFAIAGILAFIIEAAIWLCA